MSTLEAGKIFERYRIIQQLGSGISGESYEAEDIILLRKVTLKLIHPWTVLSDAARRQFFREMQGISTLNHPYLASMLDYGEINGKLYVARRYVSSGSLLGNDGRLWFRPPLSISDAIYYGHQLAQALEYIHKQGYLHGSLSFANILVSRGPNPDNYPGYAPFILADVGLANFVRRFGEPELKFLPITAAPEQLGQRVTQASDQFALAVLIYFWLTGRPPYLGTPEEIEELKLTETIAPLLSLNPKATIEQDVVLRRALTVYPEDRYPSVLAFADALLATLPPQSQSDTEIASTTQLAVITQTEPYEALEEVKTAPAAEPELIQPSEPAPIIEPEIVPQAEAAASTESEPESDLLLQPYPELSPETAPVSEIESVASEPQPAHLAEPLSSIEPEEVSEPSSPPIVEPASPVSSLEIQPVSEPEPESESASPVSSFEIQPDAEAEPESEPIVAETEVDVEYETKPTIADTEADIEQETEVDIEQEAQSTVAESEPGIEYVAESAEDTPQLQQMTDSTPQPLPDIPEPTPDPVPQPVPDLPQPLPTPDIPEPTPDPVPQPTPDPIPQPAPDVPPQVPDPVPQIVPDVPQPLPEPDTPQSTPEAGEQSEPLAEEELSISQEIVSAAQEQEPPVSIQDQELPPQLEEPETLPLTRLVIISPYAEEAYEVLVEHDETTIGRAGSSDVLLDHDNSTSRHHALLKREGDHYVLYDRRSANGVFVNGQMLMGEVGYVLEDGDHISIGNYELIFRCKRSEVADEPGESASESEVITSWSFF